MFRRILCVLLCAMLLPAYGFAQDSFTVAGYDGEDSAHDWDNNQFFARMENRTGVHLTFMQYTKRSEWQAAKNKMFQTGDLPDVLFKAALSAEEMERYTEDGRLIDLLPLLAEHAPNLWTLLLQHPDWLSAIMLPNGKIGALPMIQTPSTQNALWINQSWLEALNLPMPTDVESLQTVLAAFRDLDPNGNGRKDEVPMAFLGPWELKFFSHAWGVVANDYHIYLDDAGTVHFWPLEDSFLDMARTLKQWYADGLLDKNGFTTADELRRITDKKADNSYGAMFAPSPVNLVPFEAAADYVILDPLAFEGKQIYRDLTGPVTGGAFAITSACDDPAKMLAWVDVLYAEEGAAEALAGIEGVDYLRDESGKWDWVGGTSGMSLDALNALSLYDTGAMPWLFPTSFYGCYAHEDVHRLFEEELRFSTFLKQPFPATVLTQAQREQVAALQGALAPYVDEMLARFVLGEEPLNEQAIAAFQQQLVERGALEMVDFWQQVAQKP